jgi:hypothetical protein
MPLSLIQSIVATFSEVGTVRGSLHCCCNPFSFQMELINLCISECYVESVLLKAICDLGLYIFIVSIPILVSELLRVCAVD